MTTDAFPHSGVALVTGASGELGQAICLALARQQSFVAVHYHRNHEGAGRLAEAITAAGGAADVYEADLHAAHAADALVERVVGERGGIGVLVNNAGITRDGLLFTLADEDIEEVLDLNLKAAFRITRAAAKYMMLGRHGV